MQTSTTSANILTSIHSQAKESTHSNTFFTRDSKVFISGKSLEHFQVATFDFFGKIILKAPRLILHF